ncbi:MAG: ATP-binding protein [archaeon]
MKKFKDTIASKLIVLTLVLSIFPIAILIFYIQVNINQQLIDLSTQNLYDKVEIISNDILLFNGTYNHLTGARYQNWSYIIIDEENQNIIYSNKNSQIVYENLLNTTKQQIIDETKGVIIDKINKLGIAHEYISDRKIKVVTFSDISYIVGLIDEIEKGALIQLAISFSIIALINGFVIFLLLSPIKELVIATKKVQSGDFDVKIEATDLDGEMKTLVNGFNEMIDNLNTSRQTLKDYSNNLENKVKERTKELELKNEELVKFNKIFENALDGIVVADTETGIILDCNPAVCRLVGREKSELIGKQQSILHPKKEKEKDPNTFRKHLHEKEGQILETKVITRYGNTKDVAIIASTFKFGGKRLVYGIFRDITDKKKYEDRLLKANIKLKELDKQKDAFISIAAHELKTPLTSIKGFTELMENDKIRRSDKKKKYYLDLIHKNTNRLYNLILDLVDSSRISLGQIKMNIEKVDVESVIEETKESMMILISEKGLKSAFVFEKNLPKIKADKERVLQVLRNLIINALHYTEKGSISVSAYKKDNFVRFEVKDTGQGIPKESQDKLFSRFYQVDSSMKRKVGGSGLGLSVCKGLVELMNGKIWFDSVVSKGTTFYFTLPIAKKR